MPLDPPDAEQVLLCTFATSRRGYELSELVLRRPAEVAALDAHSKSSGVSLSGHEMIGGAVRECVMALHSVLHALYCVGVGAVVCKAPCTAFYCAVPR